MRYVNNYMTIASNSLSFHFQKHPHLRGENETERSGLYGL